MTNPVDQADSPRDLPPAQLAADPTLDEIPVAPGGHGRAHHGDVLDRSCLNVVQRLLLTTDGTVTYILEAYAGEPVEVVKIDHSFVPAGPDGAGVQALPGETVLARTVLLRGSESKRPFIYAESALAVERLDADICDALFLTDLPIGRLLFEHGVETLREVVASGIEAAGAVGFYFGIDPSASLLFRRYHIIHGGQPLMVITEKFPEASFW